MAYLKQKKRKHTIEYLLNNCGASMIVAIIVMAVVIIFTFSLLLVTYTLYASQSKKAASLKCSEAANSLSLAIQNELEDPEAYKDSWLWNYLRFNLLRDGTWPYYDSNATANHTSKQAFRYFDFKYNNNYYPVEGFPGEIKICMYWSLPDNMDPNLKQQVDAGTKTLAELTPSNRSFATLFVDITCSTGSQSYNVMNVYQVKIVEFSDQEYSDTQMLAYIKNSAESENYNPLALPQNVSAEAYLKNEKWSFELISRN